MLAAWDIPPRRWVIWWQKASDLNESFQKDGKRGLSVFFICHSKPGSIEFRQSIVGFPVWIMLDLGRDDSNARKTNEGR